MKSSIWSKRTTRPNQQGADTTGVDLENRVVVVAEVEGEAAIRDRGEIEGVVVEVEEAEADEGIIETSYLEFFLRVKTKELVNLGWWRRHPERRWCWKKLKPLKILFQNISSFSCQTIFWCFLILRGVWASLSQRFRINLFLQSARFFAGDSFSISKSRSLVSASKASIIFDLQREKIMAFLLVPHNYTCARKCHNSLNFFSDPFWTSTSS